MTEQKREIEITKEELQENKELEEQYIAAMQTEVPNLWDRIESSLPEKTVVTEDKLKKSNIRKFNVYKISAFIAACLCVVIILPVVLLFNGGKKTETAQADCAAVDAQAEDAANIEAPAAEEMEAPAAESAKMEDQAPQMEAPAAATEEKEAMAETSEKRTGNDMADKGVREENAVADSISGEEALKIEHVKVIIEPQNVALNESTLEGYKMVTIKIVEDATGFYSTDFTQNVYVNEREAETLSVGKEMTVTLLCPDPASSTTPIVYMLPEEVK